jgi:hypothetical protein
LWHELPRLDKRLSVSGAKLTAKPANANILPIIRRRIRQPPGNFFAANRKQKYGKLHLRDMEIKPLDFLIGLSLGLALGAGGAILVSRIRGWLGYSETGRLRAENRTLARRLAAKDRHIGRMLAETQRLAERLGKKSLDDLSGKSDETLTIDH